MSRVFRGIAESLGLGIIYAPFDLGTLTCKKVDFPLEQGLPLTSNVVSAEEFPACMKFWKVVKAISACEAELMAWRGNRKALSQTQKEVVINAGKNCKIVLEDVRFSAQSEKTLAARVQALCKELNPENI